MKKKLVANLATGLIMLNCLFLVIGCAGSKNVNKSMPKSNSKIKPTQEMNYLRVNCGSSTFFLAKHGNSPWTETECYHQLKEIIERQQRVVPGVKILIPLKYNSLSEYVKDKCRETLQMKAGTPSDG